MKHTLIAILILTATLAGAGEVKLAWDAPTKNTDGTELTDLAHYVLSWGPAVGDYAHSVTTAQTEASIEVPANVYQFAAVKAINSIGNESAYCAELRFRYETTPKAPSGLRRVWEEIVSWLRRTFGGGLRRVG